LQINVEDLNMDGLAQERPRKKEVKKVGRAWLFMCVGMGERE
jgi:hypothetical protein